MKRIPRFLVGVAVAAALSACSSTPKTIEQLETARAVVPQVESSPRAGAAAQNISEARKALQKANELAEKRGKVDEIRYYAMIANTNAEIANEKILEAQARDEIAKAEVERQQVILQARAREAEAERMRAESLEQELRDLKAQKTDRGLVLTLGDVLFNTGQASLNPGAYSTIDRLAAALKEDPARKVLIEGYTDSTGSEELNLQLSEARAQSVQAALMQRGVAADQITAVGKGESNPVASNETASGRQQNRRVVMIFSEAPGRQQVATDG